MNKKIILTTLFLLLGIQFVAAAPACNCGDEFTWGVGLQWGENVHHQMYGFTSVIQNDNPTQVCACHFDGYYSNNLRVRGYNADTFEEYFDYATTCAEYPCSLPVEYDFSGAGNHVLVAVYDCVGDIVNPDDCSPYGYSFYFQKYGTGDPTIEPPTQVVADVEVDGEEVFSGVSIRNGTYGGGDSIIVNSEDGFTMRFEYTPTEYTIPSDTEVFADVFIFDDYVGEIMFDSVTGTIDGGNVVVEFDVPSSTMISTYYDVYLYLSNPLWELDGDYGFGGTLESFSTPLVVDCSVGDWGGCNVTLIEGADATAYQSCVSSEMFGSCYVMTNPYDTLYAYAYNKGTGDLIGGGEVFDPWLDYSDFFGIPWDYLLDCDNQIGIEFTTTPLGDSIAGMTQTPGGCEGDPLICDFSDMLTGDSGFVLVEDEIQVLMEFGSDVGMIDFENLAFGGAGVLMPCGGGGVVVVDYSNFPTPKLASAIPGAGVLSFLGYDGSPFELIAFEMMPGYFDFVELFQYFITIPEEDLMEWLSEGVEIEFTCPDTMGGGFLFENKESSTPLMDRPLMQGEPASYTITVKSSPVAPAAPAAQMPTTSGAERGAEVLSVTSLEGIEAEKTEEGNFIVPEDIIFGMMNITIGYPPGVSPEKLIIYTVKVRDSQGNVVMEVAGIPINPNNPERTVHLPFYPQPGEYVIEISATFGATGSAAADKQYKLEVVDVEGVSPMLEMEEPEEEIIVRVDQEALLKGEQNKVSVMLEGKPYTGPVTLQTPTGMPLTLQAKNGEVLIPGIHTDKIGMYNVSIPGKGLEVSFNVLEKTLEKLTVGLEAIFSKKVVAGEPVTITFYKTIGDKKTPLANKALTLQDGLQVPQNIITNQKGELVLVVPTAGKYTVSDAEGKLKLSFEALGKTGVAEEPAPADFSTIILLVFVGIVILLLLYFGTQKMK